MSPRPSVGRYAPSPSGNLHVGNLRTAMLAWLFAHHDGGELRLRIDDLDPNVCSPEHEATQRRDLEAIGVTFAGPELRQSERSDRYAAAIEDLRDQDRLYPCYCSRREIREAAQAPHVHLPDGAYPGTCTNLDSQARAERAESRPAALRVRAGGVVVAVEDRVYGTSEELVDDFVVQRNDGVASYNLATVLDDADQGVTQVVRGADLLPGTARHVWLRDALGLSQVEHAHVPLMIDDQGERLAKRGGGVTLEELAELGHDAREVQTQLAQSIGLAVTPITTPDQHTSGQSLAKLLEVFDPRTLPTQDTVWP